jgi:pilus assembly protein CpaC
MASTSAVSRWGACACACALAYGILLTFGTADAATLAGRAPDARIDIQGEPGQTIALAVGEQRRIGAAQPLARVAVGDPAVADVLVIKEGSRNGAVLIGGKSAGTTSLTLWIKGRTEPLAYTVDVRPGAASALLDSSTPQVRKFGGDAVISDTTPTMESHQRAVAAASSGNAKGDSVTDISTIATPGVVQVDVRVVEFSRAVLKEAGLNLFKQSNGFAFGSFAPSGLASFTGGATSGFQATSVIPIASAFNLVLNSAGRGIFADLSLMESNNLARVLAEPTLVALSGQSASFLAGGEIPVPVPEGLGTTSIQYKPYGVGLTLTPTVLSPKRIALKVAPEASDLDFQNAITINGISVPAITTRRADTTVELGDGESFVIGGLIDRETSSNVSKVPLLGDLPIIGTFFKQLNYQKNDKELVIIVTPHLVSPLAKGAPLPATPGEQSEEHDAPVWRSYLGGALSRDAGPGFSQ